MVDKSESVVACMEPTFQVERETLRELSKAVSVVTDARKETQRVTYTRERGHLSGGWQRYL